MEKYKMYTLYAKVAGTNSAKYTIEESLRDDSKRQQILMCGEKIEYLDRLTDDYESIEDLLDSYPEDVFGKKMNIYEPVIFVDKHITDRTKSYEIYDIVFKEDAESIADKGNIREELKNYLINHPNELTAKNSPEEKNKFRGISKISTNIKNKYPEIPLIPLIDFTLNKYFEGDNYKRYREAYFTLKRLFPERVKRNGIHR